MEEQQDNSTFIGTVLSKASTAEANFQILKTFEHGMLFEGMLAIVKCGFQKILARISSISPYNSFYQDGDLWSSVRRVDKEFPADIATEFETGTLDLLMRLGGEFGTAIGYPPKPGDKVCLIKPEENIEELFNIGKNKKGIIWLGTLAGYERVPIPLDIEKIPMHMAIFGITGSGKSYDTGAILERLSEIPAGNNKNISYPMLIIDANGDYNDYYKQFNDVNINPSKRKIGAIGVVKKFVFKSSSEYKNKKTENLDTIGIDLDLLNPNEIAMLILSFYKSGTEDTITLSLSYLEKLFFDIKESPTGRINDYFQSEAEYKQLLKKVDTLSSGEEDKFQFSKSTSKAVKRALNKFFELENQYNLFSNESELKSDAFIDNLVNNGSMYIVDFSADGAPDVNMETKQLVMGYIAKLLYNKFSRYKSQDATKTKYCIFLIEEAQNFCPGSNYPIGASVAHNIITLIATQGRKFGLSLCLVSQRPSFIDKIVVSMCNTFFIHRISPDDISFVKNVTGGLPKSLENKLTLLNKGEFIVTGQMTTVPFSFLVRIRKDVDRKVKHTAGETRVLESLVLSRM
jgi:hypothetical protein